MANKNAWQEAAYVYAEQTKDCPYCGARVGEQCRSALGRWRRNPHADRIDDLGDVRLVGIHDLIHRVDVDKSFQIGEGDWQIVRSALRRYAGMVIAEGPL